MQIKNTSQAIIFWVISISFTWLFTSLFGKDGTTAIIGFVLGVIIALISISEWNNSQKQKRDLQITNENKWWVTQNFGNNGEGYIVIYQSGNQGVDHYLRMYARRNDLPGTLAISESGIRFVSTVTRTEQKFTLLWNEIQSALAESNNHLCIKTTKFCFVRFKTEHANLISKQINDRLIKFQEEETYKERVIQQQIHNRQLDSIPPGKFEKLIADLFQAMGYEVLQTGGTGDEGVDLVCKDHSGYEIIVQCKRYKGKVGAHTVRDFYGALTHRRSKKGFIITTGEFTLPAIQWVSGKGIELIDRYRLAELLEKYSFISTNESQQPTLWNDE